MINTLSKLLGNSPKTVSNWKKENRDIIKLLYKYFSQKELEEFLETEKIKKFENIEIIDNLQKHCKYTLQNLKSTPAGTPIIQKIKDDNNISLSSLLVFLYSINNYNNDSQIKDCSHISVAPVNFELSEDDKLKTAEFLIKMDTFTFMYIRNNIFELEKLERISHFEMEQLLSE
ncbi:MAG: hypothetical protein WA945_10145 [Arcobacteraceae bacterium]